MNAIEKMGKKKATSNDEVMDIIFQKKFWMRMRNRLEWKNQVRINWRIEKLELEEEGEMKKIYTDQN